jgi:CBS domain-containing protein
VQTKDVYRPTVATCAPDDSLHDVARTMEASDTGFLAVMADGRLHGVISERDLVRAVAGATDPRTATAAEYATTEVVGASLDEDVSVIARRMIDRGVRRLPVLAAQGELVGVVSMRDLFTLETLTAPPGEGADSP